MPLSISEGNTRLSCSQSGVALVIVLWMLSILSIIALAYSGMNRSESQITANLLLSTKGRAQAEAGFWRSVSELLDPRNRGSWKQDGTPYQLEVSREGVINPEIQLRVSIQDETGKIDLNKASQRLLRGLLDSANEDPQQNEKIVDSILDWRDRDTVKKDNGAEDKDYKKAGLSYGAKDGPINQISELLLVNGMTNEIFNRIQPAITVNSMQARVRLTTAPLIVLKALPGITDEMLEKIIYNRSVTETGLLPLPTVPDIMKPLVFNSGIGSVFTIISEAKIRHSITRLKATILLKRSGNKPITIIDWKESAPPLPEEQTIDISTLKRNTNTNKDNRSNPGISPEAGDNPGTGDSPGNNTDSDFDTLLN